MKYKNELFSLLVEGDVYEKKEFNKKTDNLKRIGGNH